MNRRRRTSRRYDTTVNAADSIRLSASPRRLAEREGKMWRFRSIPWIVVAVTAGAVGCASGGTSNPERFEGSAGQVTWEVVDIVQSVSADSRSIRWDYTIVLRETSGTSIEFEKI